MFIYESPPFIVAAHPSSNVPVICVSTIVTAFAGESSAGVTRFISLIGTVSLLRVDVIIRFSAKAKFVFGCVG